MYCSVDTKNISKEVKSENKLFNSSISLLSSTNNITLFNFSKLTKIKLISNFCSSIELSLLWNKMTKGNLKWNNLQVSLSESDIIDYYVIINKPLPNVKYDKSKTIVFRMEPDSDIHVKNHWDDWYTNKDDFLFFCDLNRYRNNTEWHLSSNYSQLQQPIIKTKLLSSVVSSLYNMVGHKFRIDMLKYIENKNELNIDIYGRENLFNFKNYRGSLPSHNKDSGILPYKYTFISENCDRKNYYTEKISDAILGECLCFYWGCSNINDFLDERSFIRLPLDLDKAYNIICNSIKNNEWEKRLPFIKQEKLKILNYYNFFPRIEGLINISELYKIVLYEKDENKEKELESIRNDLKINDVRNYNLIKNTGNYLESLNTTKNTLVINGKINTTHFNDKLAIVYKKVLDVKEWDILILDNGKETNKEYCEIIKVDNKKEFKSFIINYKTINKVLKKENLSIYRTEDRLIL
jgi:hypothetical protein